MKPTQILNSLNVLLASNYGAKFYKVDLHFHTPASADARGSNRYNLNLYQKLKPLEPCNHEYTFNESAKLAQNIVSRFVEEGLSVVAITDHNCIGTIRTDNDATGNYMDMKAPTWYELIDDEARKVNLRAGKTLLTILPGVEISNSGVHLLAIFPPQNPRRAAHFIICDLLSEVGFKIDDWGVLSATGKCSVYDTIEYATRRGGIVIPAHIDGSDQALLNLFRLTSSNMKHILLHEKLAAVEIVSPDRLKRTDKKLRKSVKAWMDEFRLRAGRKRFAFTQASDAHDTRTIGKRFSYIKMTSPSYEGLKDALRIPSSRVRLSTEHSMPQNGLYILGIEINNRFFGKKTIRFNRHLNCICGQRQSGKSYLYNLMRSAVDPAVSLSDGSVKLFMESIEDGSRRFYAWCRNSRGNAPELFQIDPNTAIANNITDAGNGELYPKPGFFIANRINEICDNEEELQKFLVKHFGEPCTENANAFNSQFSIPMFLSDAESQIIKLRDNKGRYQLLLNIDWSMSHKREKPVDFFSLNHSRKRCALIIILTVCHKFGPVSIDAPEEFLDNSDITTFLAPLIKKFKDFRQLNLFSSNPGLAVNSDPENYIMLALNNRNRLEVHSGFSIDELNNKNRIIELLEGSYKSFKHRTERYEA